MVGDAIAALRKEYTLQSLLERDVCANPLDQFRVWFEQAVAAQLLEPNAMSLATVAPDGTPSNRIVLFKNLVNQKFQFFTNYSSRKGAEIACNNRVALLFFWDELERQVRIEGTIEKCPRSESERYWASRPRGSQLGSYISSQSAVVSSRDELEQRLSESETRFASQPVPCPEDWGGYMVEPHRIEFWQGRENRLHDRILYSRGVGGPAAWRFCRLSP